MNNERAEIIHNLLYSGKNIDEESIYAKSRTPKNIIPGQFLDDNFVAEASAAVGIPAARCTDKIQDGSERILALKDKLRRSVDLMNRRLANEIAPAIHNLMVANINTAAMNTELAIMGYDNVWSENTTANISNGIIFSASSIGNKFISTRDDISITAYVSDIAGAINASIEDIDDNDKSYKKYKFKSKYKSPKRFVIDIDRNNTELINSIKFKSDSINFISVYTSKNKESYDLSKINRKMIFDGVYDIDQTQDRYIRIIVDIDNNYGYLNSEYLYKFNLGVEFGLIMSEDGVFFETKTLDVGRSGTSISMMDDCNGDIKYEVSINGSEYKILSSINNRIGKYQKFIPINNYSDNKLISIKNFTLDNDLYIADVVMPVGFIMSNKIKVFDRSKVWTKNKFGYTGSFINNSIIELNLGSSRMIIDGDIKTGDILISPGIHKIDIFDENAYQLYNSENITEDLSYINENRIIIDNQGIKRSIADPLFPNNHMYIVIDKFDHSLGCELIENVDYSIYNNEGYKISTFKKPSELIISYMLSYSNVDTIKIRGTFSESITLSSLTKILVNIS